MTFLTPELILEVDLIGFGLMVALYAVIMERMEDIRQDRLLKSKQREGLEDRETEIIYKLQTDKRNKELKIELLGIDTYINKIVYGLAYHYSDGYFVSSILFVGSVLFVFFSSLNIFLIYGLNSVFLMMAQAFLWGGVSNLCILWFLTLNDMNRILKDKIRAIEDYKVENTKKNLK